METSRSAGVGRPPPLLVREALLRADPAVGVAFVAGFVVGDGAPRVLPKPAAAGARMAATVDASGARRC